jgi:hypothetical protein
LVLAAWLVAFRLREDRGRDRVVRLVLAGAEAHAAKRHDAVESLLDQALACRSLDTLSPRLRRPALEPQRQTLLASWPEAAAVLLGSPEHARAAAQVRVGFRGLQVLERGLGLLGQQEWEAAEATLVEARDLLAAVSGHATDRVRLQLGLALTMLGDYSAAEQTLDAIRRPGDTADGWIDGVVAFTRVRAGDPSGAVEVLEARLSTTEPGSAMEAAAGSSLVETLVAVRDVDGSVAVATRLLDGLAGASDPTDDPVRVVVDAALGASIGCALAGDSGRAASCLHRAVATGAGSQSFAAPARRGTQAYVAALAYPGVAPSDPARAGGVWFRWAPDILLRTAAVRDHLLAVVDAGLSAEGTGESELRRQRARILALGGELERSRAELVVAAAAPAPSMERARVHWDVAVVHELGGDDSAALSALEQGLAGSGQGSRLRAALVHERAAVLGRLGRADLAADAYLDALERHTALRQEGDAADCRRNLDVLHGGPRTQESFVSGTFAACWPSATS